MSSLARLRALRHLDLDLFCAVQVSARHAETAGRHLLDRTVINCPEPGRELAALTGIGLSAKRIHGDGKRLVCFLRQRAVRHRSGLEALYDAFHALHLGQRNGIPCPHKGEQGPDGMRSSRVIHQARVLPELVVITGPHGLLEQNDRLRTVEMIFFLPSAPQTVEAGGIRRRIHRKTERIECAVMAHGDILADLPEADPADPAHDAREIKIDDFPSEPDRLKDPCRLVGLKRRDAHLGSRLHDAVEKGFIVVIHGRVIILIQDSRIDHLGNALMREVGIHGPDTEAEEGRHLMNVPRLAALEDQGDRRSLLGLDQMLFQRRDCEKRRDRHMVLVHAPV